MFGALAVLSLLIAIVIPVINTLANRLNGLAAVSDVNSSFGILSRLATVHLFCV